MASAVDIQRIIALLLLLTLGAIDCWNGTNNTTGTKDWWQTATFYQIYPRSFKDSNGDGIGDLNGITLKLDYIKDLGVTAVWLSPIFVSPMVDFGYDISDFYNIQPEYGTMDDFQAMIVKANELGLKIILDFVPNHSSDQHEWFKKSAARELGYENYYVWADGKIDANGQRIPPTNWLQAFRGSAWEWHEQRGQYYLHQFAVQQPDLNYRNPAVVEQMKRVMRFWLDQGIAGFRIDAVAVLFEVEGDANGRYPDESLSGLTDDPDDRNYINHELIAYRLETIDMIYQWRQVMDEYQRLNGGDTRVVIIESMAPINFTMAIYGNSTTVGAHLPFNFNLIDELMDGVTAPKLKQAVDNWLKHMPSGGTANWVIGNHDQRRAASRYGVGNTDAMNMLIMTLPGVSFSYQGEELGMIDAVISWADTVDPAACNSNPKIYEKFTRDPSRTPFHWNTGNNAGFSTAAKTWLPLAPYYGLLNVEAESKVARSHLQIFKSLVALRKSSRTLQYGNWRYAALDDNVFVLLRYLRGSAPIVFIANFGYEPITVDLSKVFDMRLPTTLKVKVRSLSSNSAEGSPISLGSVSLAAYKSLILSSV